MDEVATKFVPLDVVDGNGQPWRPKQFQAPRAAPRGRDSNWFGGFNVHGFTREQVDAVKASHEERNRALIAQDKAPLPAFDEQTYMRQTRPPKLNGKAFALEDAADQYVALQKKAGRLNVIKVRLVAKK